MDLIPNDFGSDKLKSSSRVCLSPDGKFLAVSEATATGPEKETHAGRVYDAVTGKPLHELDTAGAPAAFAPDNKSLVTRSQYAFLVWRLTGPNDT